MEKADVTIILLPCIEEQALPTALDHLARQDYPAARFEVVVLNTMPTQAASDMLDNYAQAVPMRTRNLHVKPDQLVEAINQVIRESDARWIIFVSGELAAGARLVERHIVAQENYGRTAITCGRIAVHPQADPAKVLRWRIINDANDIADGALLDYWHWRTWNLCAPRDLIIAADGFRFSPLCPAWGDVELAWRLADRAVKGYYIHDASAFAWVAHDFAAERRFFYQRGRNFSQLLNTLREVDPDQAEKMALLADHFNMKCSTFRLALDRFFAPVDIHHGITRAARKPLAPEHAERILRFDTRRGFRDGKPA